MEVKLTFIVVEAGIDARSLKLEARISSLYNELRYEPRQKQSYTVKHLWKNISGYLKN